MAILTSKSSMNIYGGTYSNNRTNDLSEGETNDVVLHSAQGGAFYNYGTLNIYGGTFTGNHAARGGFLFNYRTARIYNALIHGNTASNIGGAVYMPNSTSARLYLGGENALVESNVIFDGNTSADNGGAIYARNLLSVENTTFQNNSAAGSTGGAIHAGSMTITIDNAQFINNTAKTNGGAIYQSGSNNKDDTLDLTITNTTFEFNTAGTNGGAMYLSTDTSAYAATSQFVQNTADNGGAIYLTAAHLDADGVEFLGNTVSAAGGALAVCENASVKMNMVTATENAASKGGFAYINTAEFNLYNSTVNQNKTAKNGGAVLMDSGAFGGIYATAFEENASTGGNGGAVFVYTAGGEVTVHSCSFVENSGVSGGALYASSKSILHLYNNSANNNTATKGGFLYHTTTGTTVDLVGITLSGNTATDGGPIIWGNSAGAVLNIDKGKYYDLDYTGDWDDTYWTAAIYNSLKVKEVTKDVPKYIDYDGTEITPKLPEIPTDVASSAELEKILESGKSFIHITADFELDRTFYIPYNLTIYSSEAHTLTRAPDFGGDIFVVGQKENGDKATATLTLGNKDSAAENLLIIDGNKDNMTVDVVGSVLFVVTGSGAELYPNLTVRNAYKNGNERTIATPYGMSYPPRIGGAMLIMSNKSTVNIYGGNYTDNRSNDASEGENDDEKLYSAQGGAIYNFGTLSIYGGTFENNHAARGGFLFSYRTANIYNAQILNNAADLGGAVYMPNSTGARMYLGGVNDLVESNVLFEGNTSTSYGGAIYARNLLSVENTIFKNNASTGASGGALYTNDMVVTVDNSHFIGNAAKSYGGAIYNTVNNGKDGYDVTIRNSEFSQNQATSHGGAIYSSSGARLSVTYSMFTENTSEASGGAVYVTGGGLLDASVVTFHKNTATTNGGALVFTATAPTMATGVLNRITATENTAKNGGFLYAGSSDVRLYNSTLQSNSSTSNGGAVAMYDGASGGIYSTTFDQNASGANGGALFLYTNTGEIIVHSCTFTGNEGNYGGAAYASNKSVATFYNTTTTDNAAIKGGAFYFTTTGTTVTIIGWTTSGNTATEGGPIIWGNSTGAKLYIDKKQYTDKDHTGTYDSAYWSAAIYNKLKVYDFSGEIPKYLDYKEESYDHMADAVDVSNADQLEMAINSGAPYIRVIADFALDRTFYIPGQTVIFSTLPHTLTRAPEFGGDIFVVGETAEGISALLLGKNASLTLGNPLSVQENLLTIDGNKDNMIVPVVGTVVFMFYGSNVDIHPNITVKNCAKAGSERTCNERYNFKYQTRTGGAFAIIGNGVMNIYGGIFKNNAVNHEDTSLGDEGRISTYGGLIFNSGNLRIYDGLFENNCGARGAVVYNYRSLKVYGGRFINNTATVSGGAFYTPNVAVGNNFIGTSVDGGSQVLFQGNSSANQGGALYTGPLSTLVIYGNTSFVENQSTGSHGGAIAAYGQFTARDTLFQTNSAKKYGGAVYTANSNNNYVTRFTLLENCTFENNIARQGGALMLYASDADFDNGALVTVVDCTFTGNQAAAPGSTTTASYGGAIYMERKSELTLIGSEFKQNIARTEGGAIYAGGESVLDIDDCSFLENSVSKTGKYGGGIAIHSVYLTVNNTTFDTNTAPSNGAALYVSYSSSREVNSTVKITESAFTDNSTPSYGGAIYVTRQDVSLPKRILDVRNTSFVNNSSKAGCVYLLPSVTAYMADVTFQNNTSLEEAGGAITATGSTLEMDTAAFTGNTSAGSGGAIAMTKSAAVTLNAITAQNNTATNTGGFLYSNGSTLKMYDSTIQNNTSTGNGGGLALYDGAVASIYNTTVQNNTAAEGNGGGVFAYTGGTKVILHTCSVLGNSANFGGGIYASNASVMDIYKITATDNTAKKGGFLYETTTGTTILLVGAAVGSNTAAEGGPIIWGNSKGAVLNLNKSLFVDNDTTGSLDDAYWATAIVNALTVNTIATTTPGYTKYTGTKDPGTTPTVTIKDPVPVQEIFDLAQKPTSDADIDSYYAKFPRLDNSSNFMSKNATTFENINGGTVTVDTFVYPTNGKADNCTVGEGLLIYQAMLYKQAHPEEEVHIDISSYRFSVQASVNINRNSRYFGYMRQLSGVEYDQYGFVRVAYLLVSAAKMGIHVNVIGHIDAYPMSENLLTYFNTRMSYGCDPAYAAGGAVGDYLHFYSVKWDLGEKGGTDMMHTKLCAVSHYLDMHGVEHQNAIWTSSSNLDGINKSGTNANWKLQTGTIVSDHADLYRVSVNYLRSMLPYMGQEQIYEW
ncbi:MAG: right-handed parallel beta-helix repeat-containing protein [Clostridia bacterium]|nr:right-handed parallel beta-helix repeat-containing protein [Clostridia bacterium]